MHALRLESPKTFRPIDLAEAPPPGPGEALVRVHRIGICGTDISAYLGKMPFVTYPRILGHELGVEVLAIGEGVTNIKPGDRSSVEPYINDPDSYASRHGRPNCCEKLQVLGVHTDGGMRPQFNVPARKLHVGGNLSFEQLALVETLAIGCHAVSRSGLIADETCLIIGAGPIGLATLEFVKLTGAKIAIADLSQSRLDFCRRQMHVEHAIVVGQASSLPYQPEASARDSTHQPDAQARTNDFPSQLREVFSGHLPDVVIDATGNPNSMSAATGLIAPGGRLVYAGLTGEEIHFSHSDFHRPEGTLLCSRNALPADFTQIIGLIQSGRLDTRPWITHRWTLVELPDTISTYLNPDSGVVKAIVAVD